MYGFTGVRSQEIPAVWASVKKLLRPAMDDRVAETKLEEIFDDLLNRNRQLWIVHESAEVIIAVITSIHHDNKQKKFCAWEYIGGSSLRASWHFSQILVDWAKSQRCDYLYTHCRPGLKRIYCKDWTPIGKTEHGVELKKEL